MIGEWMMEHDLLLLTIDYSLSRIYFMPRKTHQHFMMHKAQNDKLKF